MLYTVNFTDFFLDKCSVGIMQGFGPWKFAVRKVTAKHLKVNRKQPMITQFITLCSARYPRLLTGEKKDFVNEIMVLVFNFLFLIKWLNFNFSILILLFVNFSYPVCGIPTGNGNTLREKEAYFCLRAIQELYYKEKFIGNSNIYRILYFFNLKVKLSLSMSWRHMEEHNYSSTHSYFRR